MRTTSKNLSDNSETTVLNCFERDVPAGNTIDNLLSEHIYVVDRPNKPISLQIKTVVIEVDHDSIDGEAEVLETVRNLSDFVGALFPSLIVPYVGVGTTILSGLTSLIKQTKKSENIFNCELNLDGSSEIPAGAYIFFQDNAENIESKYGLRGLRIERKPSISDDIIDDYLIIKVVPGVVSAGGEEDLLQNQQLATIIEDLDNSELSDGEMRDKLFTFLKNTLENVFDKQDLDHIYKIYNYIQVGETFVDLDAEDWNAIQNRIGGLFSQTVIDRISQIIPKL